MRHNALLPSFALRCILQRRLAEQVEKTQQLQHEVKRRLRGAASAYQSSLDAWLVALECEFHSNKNVQ